MSTEPILPRKWRVKAHQQQIILLRGMQERGEHVVMKALLWALYLPFYSTLQIEVSIDDRYKPDVIAHDEAGNLLFWGESGKVGKKKIQSLVRRYSKTHFAIAKWDVRLETLIDIVAEAREQSHHTAPFDLIRFPPDSLQRYIDKQGNITLTHDALVAWKRLSQL
ncbi:MAG: hypothetical protein K8I82_31055 [Anaerolineae bacterium]|nr:hypothetical protein [Anaerolineae bacterium]